MCCMMKASAQSPKWDKACSRLREIAYQASYQQFTGIIDRELRRSNGHGTHGSWIFETVRYSTTLSWPGALETSIEHYSDQRDSINIESWQYLADFGSFTQKEQANQYFQALAEQVEGCDIPLQDTVIVSLQPASEDELPPTIPAGLEQALLFTIPAGNDAAADILMMVGMEKTKRGYRPFLIIENYWEKSRF